MLVLFGLALSLGALSPVSAQVVTREQLSVHPADGSPDVHLTTSAFIDPTVQDVVPRSGRIRLVYKRVERALGQDGDDALHDAIEASLAQMQAAGPGVVLSVRTAVEVDSVAWQGYHPLVEGGMEDPFGTLAHGVLFAASDDDGVFGYVIGFYEAGQVRWHSAELVGGLACGSVEFPYVGDLNLGNDVEIVAACLPELMQVVRAFDPGELWIFSWNGEAARRIHAIDADGRSQIFSQYGRSFSFPDLDGDGVREIGGLTGEPDHPEYLYWSWDGEHYRNGPGTPEPRHPNFFPADAAEADVAVRITASDTAYIYHYSVASRQTSKRRISGFHIEHGQDESLGAATDGWRFNAAYAHHPLSWKYYSHDGRRLIGPGEMREGYTIISVTPPGIYAFYIRSEHEPAENTASLSYGERIEDVRRNSFQGLTLAPAAALEPFNGRVYLDTLGTYLERAEAIGWIEGDELQRSLEAKLDNALRQLERGNHAAAVGLLQTFANEVEGHKGKALSDEGYTLLKLNASHLIDRLTASSDRGDDR